MFPRLLLNLEVKKFIADADIVASMIKDVPYNHKIGFLDLHFPSTELVTYVCSTR